ncbi:MAG: CopG family transcriptional regulator [Acidobacteria bacterium]|nr:CopG family transcriptional regulator [Acidobacteriota bacterium]
MKTKLRNITLTLEETVAKWARLEAARQDTSVSRLLADILKERMESDGQYARAMRRALAREPFLETDGQYLSREQTHERSHLR